MSEGRLSLCSGLFMLVLLKKVSLLAPRKWSIWPRLNKYKSVPLCRFLLPSADTYGSTSSWHDQSVSRPRNESSFGLGFSHWMQPRSELICFIILACLVTADETLVLWLVSPSKLAVITYYWPCSWLVFKTITLHGTSWSSVRYRISPTWTCSLFKLSFLMTVTCLLLARLSSLCLR